MHTEHCSGFCVGACVTSHSAIAFICLKLSYLEQETMMGSCHHTHMFVLLYMLGHVIDIILSLAPYPKLNHCS